MRQNAPSRKRKEAKTAIRMKSYALMSACALLLVAGFFFAGRQHFASMDYGMKNARLRKQVDELESEKRRLLLAREVSLSPTEIKKAVRKVGMAGRTDNAPEMAQVASTTREKAVPQSSASKSLVVKTASVTAAPTKVAAVYNKDSKQQRPERAALRVTTSAE